MMQSFYNYHKKKNSHIFNSLPNWKDDLVQNKKKFIRKIKSVLMEQSCYLVNDFLDSCGAL
jgi:hypothetical protein